MLLIRRALATGSATAFCAAVARADDVASPVSGKRVALSGYNPVACFTDRRPVQCISRYWYEFDDTVYLFASDEHRASFIADPDHYAPQYRGYCAMSVSIGGHYEGLPGTWEILNGKLCVFGKTTGVQDFATDQPGVIARGQANWAATRPK